MSQKTALLVVFLIALFGAVFSGTLTYRELWGGSALQCPSPGAPGTVLGYPACVYGFFMYLVLAVVSGIGLFSRKKNPPSHPTLPA